MANLIPSRNLFHVLIDDEIGNHLVKSERGLFELFHGYWNINGLVNMACFISPVRSDIKKEHIERFLIQEPDKHGGGDGIGRLLEKINRL